MTANTKKGVPGIDLAAVDAIQDPNTRLVVKSIVDGWHVRNGAAGDGSSRFVTSAELSDLSRLVSTVQTSVAQVEKKTNNGLPMTAGQISGIITDLEASVMESVLFKELGDRIKLINIKATGVATGLATEVIDRKNADNAFLQTTTTQFAAVNGNIAALQTQNTTMANNVAALSSSVNTVQAQVGTNTAAIQQEATARVNTDNDIYAKYSVKIDNNGYVSGFGLISTSNNSTPTSDFIVRADRFAIGSPSGPGITPTVPFIVLTTPDAKGNGPGVYMAKAMIKRADIGTAQIDDAAVTTLKIGGEAVIVPRFSELYATGISLTTSYTSDIVSTTFNIAGLDFTESARVLVFAIMQAYPSDSTTTNLVMGIFANGTLNTEVASSYSFAGISMSNIGSFFVPNGTHTVSVRVRCDPNPGGSSSKPASNFVTRIVVMTAKR